MAIPKGSSSFSRKFALIIGNDGYSQPFNRLSQSRNNANDLSDLLKTIDFKVTLLYNLNKQQITNSFIDFAKTIDDGSLVLFCYSGHACEVDGENYFIPVGVDIESDRDIEDFSVNTKRQLDRLVNNNKSGLTIFIVDAYKSYLLQKAKTSDMEPKYLSEIKPPAGAFIQFAGAANQIIKDPPETGRNSLLVKQLLNHIAQENVDVTDVFRDVTEAVYKESRQRQKPFSANGFRKKSPVYLNEVIKPPTPEPDPIDDEWNEKTEGSFESAKKAQDTLKVYYDNYPSIDEVTDDRRPEVQQAQALTQSILRELPSGNVTERATVCHVLHNMLQSQNVECLFFDSNQTKGLHDASGILGELGSTDRPFVLKLSSSDGLANSIGPQTEHGAIRQAQQLTAAIDKNESHPIVEDVRNRLAKAHRTRKENICLKSMSAGSLYVTYTVKDSMENDLQSLRELPRRLKDNFENYSSAKLHPLLCRPAFDISMFDPKGNKTFPNTQERHEVGPPGRTQTYLSPAGWTRYGLKVLGRYTKRDNWLEPFGDPGNWYRAFHGTGRASVEDFSKSKESFEKSFAPVDAMASIHKTGFRKARVDKYGAGVYCSPDPAFPERGYVGTVPCDTQQGRKSFKCMLQVAVNPDGVKFTTDKSIWVVPNPEDIRPYGILIKEA